MARKTNLRKADWFLIVVSFFLALFLEFIFYSPNNSELTIVSAVIDIVDLPENLMVVDPPNAQKGIPAQVELRGPSPLISQVKTENLRFSVSLKSVDSSEVVRLVDIKQLRLPSGVEIVSVSPTNVKIRTEPVVRKEVQISVTKLGKPAENYQATEISVFPRSVVIRGPQSLLEAIHEVETEPVDISGITASVRNEVTLRITDPLITASVTLVTVSVKVDVIQGERTLDNLSITLIPPEGFAATVEPLIASAVISGPVDSIQKLDPKSVILSADARLLKRGKYELKISSDVPKGIKVLKTSPEKVLVRVVTSHG